MILPYLSIIGPGYTPFGGLGKYRRGRGYACGVHRRGRSGVTYYQQQEWFSKKGFSLRSLRSPAKRDPRTLRYFTKPPKGV